MFVISGGWFGMIYWANWKCMHCVRVCVCVLRGARNRAWVFFQFRTCAHRATRPSRVWRVHISHFSRHWNGGNRLQLEAKRPVHSVGKQDAYSIYPGLVKHRLLVLHLLFWVQYSVRTTSQNAITQVSVECIRMLLIQRERRRRERERERECPRCLLAFFLWK